MKVNKALLLTLLGVGVISATPITAQASSKVPKAYQGNWYFMPFTYYYKRADYFLVPKYNLNSKRFAVNYYFSKTLAFKPYLQGGHWKSNVKGFSKKNGHSVILAGKDEGVLQLTKVKVYGKYTKALRQRNGDGDVYFFRSPKQAYNYYPKF